MYDRDQKKISVLQPQLTHIMIITNKSTQKQRKLNICGTEKLVNVTPTNSAVFQFSPVIKTECEVAGQSSDEDFSKSLEVTNHDKNLSTHTKKYCKTMTLCR